MAFLVAILVFLAVLFALRRPLRAYFKVRKMELALPGPPTLPLLGNTLDFVGVNEDTVVSTLLDLTSDFRFGLSRLSAFGILFIFVGDADIIEIICKRRDLQDKPRVFYSFSDSLARRGLATLNGTEWRGHRHALQPAFLQHILERHIDIFAEEADTYVERLVPSKEHSVEDDLMTFTARSFVRTMLHGDVGEEHIHTFIQFVGTVSHSMMWRMTQPLLWPDFVFKYLTKTGHAIHRFKAKVDIFIADVISRRREELARLRADGIASDSDLNKRSQTLIELLVGPKNDSSKEEDSVEWDDIAIMDEMKLFFGAAVETTAGALGWTLKVLSVRPEIQERMHTEVIEQLAGKEALTWTDISQLKFTEQVIKETMRLLPVLPFIARLVKEDTELLGYKIPANSALVLNFYACHRDPKNWPNPLLFDPDRFSPEGTNTRHPYAYLPFSAGTRNYIGSRYAMLAMKTFLAKLMPRYRVDPVPDGHTDPATFPFTSSASSRMPGGIRVVFRPRQGH